MAIRVRIPPALERYLPGRELAVEAASVGEALDALPEGLRTRVLDESGRVRSHLAIFVGERGATPADPLADGDLVEIVAAVEGG